MVSKEVGSGGKAEVLGVEFTLIVEAAGFLDPEVGVTRGFDGGKMAERAASVAASLSWGCFDS